MYEEFMKCNIKPDVYLAISGGVYGATAYPSVSDLEYFSKLDVERTASDVVIKDAMMQLIDKHLLNFPEDTEIVLRDSEFFKFFDTYIDGDEKMPEIYHALGNENYYLHFYEAMIGLDKYYKESFKKSAKKVLKGTDSLLSTVERIERATAPFKSIAQTTEVLGRKLDLVDTEVYKAGLSAMGSVGPVSELSSVIRLSDAIFHNYALDNMVGIAGLVMPREEKIIMPVTPSYIKAWDRIVSNVSGVISSLRTPEIDEDRRKHIENAYIEWGKMGWTIVPDAPMKIYTNAPQSSQDANIMMRPYIKDDVIRRLQDLSLNFDRVNHDDLAEAYDDFFLGHYKSSAMMLFSLIDGIIIEMQGDDYTSGRRKTGKKGADKVYNKMFDENIIISGDTYTLFWMLRLENCHEALKVFFSDGNDFIDPPDYINRNWLAHGMLRDDVERYQCAQLMYLYYSILDLISDDIAIEIPS